MKPCRSCVGKRLLLVFGLLCFSCVVCLQVSLVWATNTTECRVTQNTSTQWCQTELNKGGNMTATDWTNTSFTCSCNDNVTVEIATSTVPNASDMTCTWAGLFDRNLPDPAYCHNYSGVCPTACAQITGVCDTTTSWCAATPTGYNYTCAMCSGETYTILYDGKACAYSQSSTFACNTESVCRGNGCCAVPSTSTKLCNCYQNSVNGYWDGLHCLACAAGYTVDSQGKCLVAKPTIEIILSSIAKTWTMVLPNVMVIFLFVVCGIARRPWESETTFSLTTLRRTNLSAVQLERRGRQSLFHHNKLPKRPTQSRSFANSAQPQEQHTRAY